jgi:hypothetical protein
VQAEEVSKLSTNFVKELTEDPEGKNNQISRKFKFINWKYEIKIRGG